MITWSAGSWERETCRFLREVDSESGKHIDSCGKFRAGNILIPGGGECELECEDMQRNILAKEFCLNFEGRKSWGRQAHDVINMRSRDVVVVAYLLGYTARFEPDVIASNFISSEFLPALASYYPPYFYFDFSRAPCCLLWLSTRTTLVSSFPYIPPCRNIADPCFSSR